MGKQDLSGRILRGFVLRDRINEGGFGQVYLSEQPLLGREAVVKVLHRRLQNDPVAQQRFLREAQFLARLDHPHELFLFAGHGDGDHRNRSMVITQIG